MNIGAGPGFKAPWDVQEQIAGASIQADILKLPASQSRAALGLQEAPIQRSSEFFDLDAIAFQADSQFHAVADGSSRGVRSAWRDLHRSR